MRFICNRLILPLLFLAVAAMAQAADNPLDAWKPGFDPSGAQFV